MRYQATAVFSVCHTQSGRLPFANLEVSFPFETTERNPEELTDLVLDEGMRRVKEVLLDAPGGQEVYDNFDDYLVWPKSASLNTIQ
jgi:hypothetical protein